MMPSMMFKLNENSIAAFKERGEWESVRKINHFTGYGLWMFWVYFAYLALFGIIALVWPSYPGLALTNWIADTFPYGVLAITEEMVNEVHTPLSKSVILHIVIWQLIVAVLLWFFFMRKVRMISKLFYKNLLSWKDLAPDSWTRIKTVARMFVFQFFVFGVVMIMFSYIFDTWILLTMAGFRDTGWHYMDFLGFVMWLSGPLALCQIPFFLILATWYHFKVGLGGFPEK